MPGLAGVPAARPPTTSRSTSGFAGPCLRIYDDMQALPELYVGMWHWGDQIIFEVPPADLLGWRGRYYDRPGIEVVVSDRSTAARLMQIQAEVGDMFPEIITHAGIDWKRHQVVVGVMDAGVDVRF